MDSGPNFFVRKLSTSSYHFVAPKIPRERLALFEHRHEEAVGAKTQRRHQQGFGRAVGGTWGRDGDGLVPRLMPRYDRVLRKAGEEGFDLILIFRRKDRAGDVDEAPARLDEDRAPVE